MNEFTTTTNILRAHLMVAPKNDVRFYLAGIYVDMRGNKGTDPALVSTDGHRLLVTRITEFFNGNRGSLCIIHRALIEAVIKISTSKKGVDVLVQIDDKKNLVSLTANGMTFSKELVDGRYPDYRKVIPSETSGETSVLNENYRGDAMKICQLLGYDKPYLSVHENGTSAARIEINKNTIFLVMPTRPESGYDPRTLVRHDDSWLIPRNMKSK